MVEYSPKILASEEKATSTTKLVDFNVLSIEQVSRPQAEEREREADR